MTRTQAAKQKKKFAQERRAADEAKRIAAATLLQSRYRGNSARVAHITKKAGGKKKRRKLRRKRKPQPEAAEKPVQSRKGLSRLAAPSARLVEHTKRALSERAHSREGDEQHPRDGAEQDGCGGAPNNGLNQSDFRSARQLGNPYVPSYHTARQRPTVLPPPKGAPATREVYRRSVAQVMRA